MCVFSKLSHIIVNGPSLRLVWIGLQPEGIRDLLAFRFQTGRLRFGYCRTIRCAQFHCPSVCHCHLLLLEGCESGGSGGPSGWGGWSVASWSGVWPSYLGTTAALEKSKRGWFIAQFIRRLNCRSTEREHISGNSNLNTVCFAVRTEKKNLNGKLMRSSKAN